jgi:flagellar protein FliO/FliZ
MTPGITSLLWFVALVAAIPLVLWLIKRTPMGGAATGAGLKTVAVLPLSASQRIVTVEVGEGEERRWLVLGVSPGNIQTLHLMDAQAMPSAAAAAPATPNAAFAQLLSRLRQDRKDPHGR